LLPVPRPHPLCRALKPSGAPLDIALQLALKVARPFVGVLAAVPMARPFGESILLAAHTPVSPFLDDGENNDGYDEKCQHFGTRRPTRPPLLPRRRGKPFESLAIAQDNWEQTGCHRATPDAHEEASIFKGILRLCGRPAQSSDCIARTADRTNHTGIQRALFSRMILDLHRTRSRLGSGNQSTKRCRFGVRGAR